MFVKGRREYVRAGLTPAYLLAAALPDIPGYQPAN